MIPLFPHRRRSAAARRPGITVIVVLGLLAVSLAISYSILRTQTTTNQTQVNADLRASARQAAQTGLAVGLRRLHDGNWGGIGQSLSGALASGQAYSLTYTNGDASLASGDTDWPYRLTLDAVGTATDPARPAISASYRMQAVVRLRPRQLSTAPAVYSTMVGYTVYQYNQAEFEVQCPARVSGSVRLQNNLRLYDTYPGANYGLNRYLSDLNAMRSNGYGDNRPLSGPVNLPYSQTSSSIRSQLTSQLGVTTNDISVTSASGWSFPSAINSYQLYPGGATYSVPTVASTLSNTTLAADPRTNPLGLFYRSGSLTIQSNVTVRGTLIASGTVTVTGSNVQLQAASELPLDGTTQAVQLPVLVGGNDLLIGSGAQVTVRGLVALWDDFNIQVGSQSTVFDMQGRLICSGFAVEERNEWNLGSGWWSVLWSLFNSQLSPVTSSTISYYPVWLSTIGLPYVPALTVVPETSSVKYHWKDGTNTVYAANSSDPGLRWTVVRWQDNNGP